MKTFEIIGIELSYQTVRLVLLVLSALFYTLIKVLKKASHDTLLFYRNLTLLCLSIAIIMRVYEHHQIINYIVVQPSGVEFFLKKTADIISAILGVIILIPFSIYLQDHFWSRNRTIKWGNYTFLFFIIIVALNTLLIFAK